MTTIAISVFAVAALVAALIAVIRRCGFAGGDLPLNADWIDDLSVERYRPMLRLLDERDIEFLRSQPGFTPRMAARLRAQRTQIFRGYLRNLAVAIGNNGNESDLPILEQAIHATRDEPMIKEHAKWAMEKVKSKR